jgi:hypothetical protein
MSASLLLVSTVAVLILILIILMLTLSSIFIRTEPILVHALLISGFVHAGRIRDEQVTATKSKGDRTV